MYRALQLKRLLIYSDIYGLGLTQKDVDHLQVVFDAYKSLVTMEYIYKAATPGYDLVLNLNMNEKEPYLNLINHEPIVTAAGYPVIKMDNIYLKFLPQVSDLEFLKTAADFIPTSTDKHPPANLIFDSVDQVKKQIINDELPYYKPDYYNPLDPDTIDMLYMCAGKKSPKVEIKKQDYNDMPIYINHIVEVLQLPDDNRIAFYVTKKNAGYYSRGFETGLAFYTVKVGETAYNWTDPDRYFSHIDGDTNLPKIFYIDPHPVFPKDKDVIDNYRRGQNVLTIDNATLDTLVKRWIRKQQDQQNEALAIKALESKLKSKIDGLATGNEFAYNDVTFRKNEFEYEGQIISCADVEMKDILGKFAGQYSEDHLNFDRILDTWMRELYRKATSGTVPVKGKIGDVKFKLEHTTRKAKDGVVTHVYRVNDCRINKDEVEQVIGRAICFPDTATFEEFCETVAHCSLKYHKYLAGGICVNVRDEIFGQNMEFKITLERHKNKNLIVFNGKKFNVKNTNRLLSILTARAMSRVIDILLDDKVAGMGGDDIKSLMTTGRQLLIDQRAREENLLKSTIDMFGVEHIDDFHAQNGKLLRGYLVKGGLRNYVIEEKNLLVFEHPTGRYICMIDRGTNTEHTNTVRLVNRFYALSNDSKLAKEISTL